MQKLFIIGLGKRGLVHAEVLSARNDVVLIGGYDASQEARDLCKQSWSFPVYENLLEGLKQAQPDFILIATPPQIRAQLFQNFVDLPGLKAIFVEKPLALSMNEALSISHLALEKNWDLLVMHQSRFCDEFIALKESINSGRIGKLIFLKSSCYGNLFNQGSHAVDLIRWLTNDQRVLWVDATGNNNRKLINQLASPHIPLEADPDHPGDLWTSITMRLQSEIEVFMTCGLLDTNPLPTLGPWLQRRIVAVGTKGYAEAHLASYFKEVSQEFSPQYHQTSPEKYLLSLHRYYDYFFSARESICNNRTKIVEDHLFTLGTLFAALISSKQHQLTSIPDDVNALAQFDEILNEKTPQTLNDDGATFSETSLLISVIVPMETNRGMGEKAVLSWVEQQCQPEQYEVILVFHAHQRKLKQYLNQKLRPQDKAICVDAENEMDLCHYGAMIARGKYLLFTESHCIAEPDTVGEAIQFFKTEHYDGFYPYTIAICKNAIAEMEAKLYELGFSEFSKADSWAKITLHAFGINKNVYFDAGGFTGRYNRFSYWLLAANLFKKGYSLGYAPDVKVKHSFVENFRHFNRFVAECMIGECQFRVDTQDQNFCRQFFGLPEEWKRARVIQSKIMKLISKNLLQLVTSQKNDHALTWKNFLAAIFKTYLDQFSLKWYYFKNRLFHQIRYLLADKKSEQAWQHYYQYFQLTLEWYRVKYALSIKEPAAKKSGFMYNQYSLSEFDEDHLFGFYIPEIYHGQEFRWSSNISAIKLYLNADQKVIKLKLVKSIRAIELSDFMFFINTTRVKEVQFDLEQLELTFQVPDPYLKRKKAIWLICFATPWQAALANGESRVLGLPIQEMQIV